jgi:hypothetical protein
MTTYAVNVVDASGAPVPNPQVFLNGSALTSPDFGLETGQTATLQASAPGYLPATQTVTGTLNPAWQQVTIPLASAAPAGATAPFTVTLQPPVPGMEPPLVGGGNSYSPMANQDGSQLYYNVPPGQYTASFVDTNGQLATQEATFNVQPGGSSSGATVQMAAKTDAGNQTGVPAPPAAATTVYPEDSIPLFDSGSEAVAANDSFQGYYTSAQVNASINGIVLDELNTVQWALQTNTIPIYGYASRDADGYGAGRSLVQGQLVLNFVHERYLYAVLQADPVVATSSAVKFGDPNLDAAVQLSQLLQRQNQVGTLPAGQQAAASSSLNQRVDSALASSPPSVVSLARTLAKQPGADPYANPVYLPGPFDLRIEIGTGPAKRVRMLQRCKLISDEVICDQTGQPILEAYGFIARRSS